MCVKERRKRKQEKFTALLHHLTVDLLRESYFGLKRRAAPGVDGETWQQYGARLKGRLADLQSRVHRGAYRAKPSRRTYIKKSDGRPRPLGIAALEDKIVQQAVRVFWQRTTVAVFTCGFPICLKRLLAATTLRIRLCRPPTVLPRPLRGESPVGTRFLVRPRQSAGNT